LAHTTDNDHHSRPTRAPGTKSATATSPPHRRWSTLNPSGSPTCFAGQGGWAGRSGSAAA